MAQPEGLPEGLRPFHDLQSCGKLACMSKVTNLNQFRKQQARVKKRAQGAENCAKFGRTKTQSTLEERQKDKARRDLDGHAREDAE